MATTDNNHDKFEQCIEALRQNSKDREAAMELARIYLNQQDLPEAIAALKKCVNIDPDFDEAKNLLKQALLQQANQQAGPRGVNPGYTFYHFSWDDTSFAEMTPAVITAFEAVSKYNPDFSLLVCSNRPLQGYPWEIIDLIVNNPQIDFYEFNQAGDIVLPPCSIFIYPALADQFAQIINAMPLNQIVLILSDTPAAKNLVINAKTGILVQTVTMQTENGQQRTLNLNELAAKMFLLGSDPELTSEMANAAQHMAQAHA
jgi:tetratricopeptide (TPR) repeat protein